MTQVIPQWHWNSFGTVVEKKTFFFTFAFATIYVTIFISEFTEQNFHFAFVFVFLFFWYERLFQLKIYIGARILTEKMARKWLFCFKQDHSPRSGEDRVIDKNLNAEFLMIQALASTMEN